MFDEESPSTWRRKSERIDSLVGSDAYGAIFREGAGGWLVLLEAMMSEAEGS